MKGQVIRRMAQGWQLSPAATKLKNGHSREIENREKGSNVKREGVHTGELGDTKNRKARCRRNAFTSGGPA